MFWGFSSIMFSCFVEFKYGKQILKDELCSGHSHTAITNEIIAAEKLNKKKWKSAYHLWRNKSDFEDWISCNADNNKTLSASHKAIQSLGIISVYILSKKRSGLRWLVIICCKDLEKNKVRMFLILSKITIYNYNLEIKNSRQRNFRTRLSKRASIENAMRTEHRENYDHIFIYKGRPQRLFH